MITNGSFCKNHSKGIAACCICLLALVASWLWFTRPVSASQRLRGARVSSVEVIDMVTPPGGPTEMDGIVTEDGGEIQALMSLLDTYPDSRRFDWDWLFGAGWGNWGDGEAERSVWVRLFFTGPDGKPDSLEYIASERGRLQVFEPNRSGDVPAGVGRFGDAGAKQYFETLHRFYEQKADGPLWSGETIGDGGNSGAVAS